MRRIVAPFLAVFLIILISGCSSSNIPIEGMSEEDVFERVLEANERVTYYRMDADTDYLIEMDVLGEEVSISTEFLISGFVDKANKEFSFTGTIKGVNEEGERTEEEFEVHSEGGYVISKSGDDETREAMTDEYMSNMDAYGKIYEMLTSEEIERLPDESMSGQGYYVFMVEPDMEDVIGTAMPSDYDQELIDTEFPDAEFDYRVKVWVNKDTFVLEKNSMHINMTSEMLSMEVDYNVMIYDIRF